MTPDKPKGISKLRFWGQNSRVNRINDLPIFMQQRPVEVLSLETGERRSLVTGGTNPHYAPSGHILFARAGSLFAVPFDTERLQVTGPATAVLQDLRMDEGGGAAQFTVASDGSLVYARESARALDRTLVRVDRQGKARAITEKRHRFRHPRLSPDGRRVAVTITNSNGNDLWIQEVDRDILTRLTFEGSSSIPIWSPDGMRLAFFNSNRAGAASVLVKSAGGGGEVEELARGVRFPSSWSSDGRVMIVTDCPSVPRSSPRILERRGAFRNKTPGSHHLDITLLRLDGDVKPEPLLGTRSNELQAALSPDDRWLAYTSDETGRSEVFVVPFPEASGKRQISTKGGTEPRWARDGRELFYRNGDKMMAVAIDTEPELSPAKPVLLFEGPYAQGTSLFGFFDTPPYTNYDVAPDGEGFIMIQQEERGGSRAELEVVLNWFEELKRLVPAN